MPTGSPDEAFQMSVGPYYINISFCCSGYGCAGGSGAMSGGGESAQFGATAAMVAAATTAAMQDSQPFSQVYTLFNIDLISRADLLESAYIIMTVHSFYYYTKSDT